MSTSVRKSAGIVSAAVMGSRLLGLVREVVFAAMYNAGTYLDAYLAAFQIPNLMRDLFAEGALSTAFTTTFAKTWEKEGSPPAWTLAHLIFSTMLLVVGSICVLGIVASPFVVQVTNFGFHQVAGKFELTVNLTRLLFPFILFVSLAAVVMGILNARFIFGLPASASTIFNLVAVAAGGGLAWLFDPQLGARSLYGLCLGVLLGGLAQLAVQLPPLWRLGFRFRWRIDFRNPALRQVWRLMWPSAIAGAAVQVNVMVNGMFASEIDGARSWLNCAFRLMQFPIGVFGVAIATAILPAVARYHSRGDSAAFGRTVAESLRLAFFLTLPAAAGLAALAPEIIRAIYQHGRFDAASTAQTAIALRAYAVGLAGYAAIKVLVPCFYALDKPRIPLLVSLFGIGVNLGLNFLLVKGFGLGHVGLALTTGILALLNFGQLLFYLRRHTALGAGREWRYYLLRVILAAEVSAIGAWQVARGLTDALAGLAGALLPVVGGVAVGAVLYLAVAFFLEVPETVAVWQRIRQLARKN
jgi:putative peptidoglycan lipid II flippase